MTEARMKYLAHALWKTMFLSSGMTYGIQATYHAGFVEVMSCSHLIRERTTGKSITVQLRLRSCPKPFAIGNQKPVPTSWSSGLAGIGMPLGSSPEVHGAVPHRRKASPRSALPFSEFACRTIASMNSTKLSSVKRERKTKRGSKFFSKLSTKNLRGAPSRKPAKPSYLPPSSSVFFFSLESLTQCQLHSLPDGFLEKQLSAQTSEVIR
mmetsp:Transcript_17127/g.39249  ORF Transcript_17127/g.39249 Transcript_17127/m.39249 type:complete len:209 (-) Transcript_17127:715-1341(-)